MTAPMNIAEAVGHLRERLLARPKGSYEVTVSTVALDWLICEATRMESRTTQLQWRLEILRTVPRSVVEAAFQLDAARGLRRLADEVLAELFANQGGQS